MEDGLKPVTLSLLVCNPPAFVDERCGSIFVTDRVVQLMYRSGCKFSAIPVYVDGRWLNIIDGARYEDYRDHRREAGVE